MIGPQLPNEMPGTNIPEITPVMPENPGMPSQQPEVTPPDTQPPALPGPEVTPPEPEPGNPSR